MYPSEEGHPSYLLSKWQNVDIKESAKTNRQYTWKSFNFGGEKSKSSSPRRAFLLIMKNSTKNYFSDLSKWIGNFGVVPLLLFKAFLFLPILVFLLSLLFLVTLVLETIFQLLCARIFRCFTLSRPEWHIRNSINRKKLHTFGKLVKVPLYFVFMANAPIHGFSLEKSKFQDLTMEESKTMTLAKGEIKQLPGRGLTKFSIGNKEVISVKTLKREGDLLVKGLSLGHSNLYLWKKNRQKPEKWDLFVYSKRHHLGLKELSISFEKLGLESKIAAEKLFISGIISNSKDYRVLIDLFKKRSDIINLDRVELKGNFKKEVFTNFISSLSERSLLDLDCNIDRLFIKCQGAKSVSESIEDLKEKYLIQFKSENSLTIGKQFKITLTLQQYENSQGEAFEFGLQQVKGNLNQLLIEDPLALIRENQIHLKENSFKSQTLAHPILKGAFNSPIQVRIGQEINFLQSVNNGVATQSWRFAGLGIDITLKPHTQRVLISYKTNLSQPGENGITVNSQKSELIVALNEDTILFDIGFNVNHERKSQLPILGDIPLFGSLFSGRGKETSYKKILCLIKLEEIVI